MTNPTTYSGTIRDLAQAGWDHASDLEWNFDDLATPHGAQAAVVAFLLSTNQTTGYDDEVGKAACRLAADARRHGAVPFADRLAYAPVTDHESCLD